MAKLGKIWVKAETEFAEEKIPFGVEPVRTRKTDTGYVIDFTVRPLRHPPGQCPRHTIGFCMWGEWMSRLARERREAERERVRIIRGGDE